MTLFLLIFKCDNDIMALSELYLLLIISETFNDFPLALMDSAYSYHHRQYCDQDQNLKTKTRLFQNQGRDQDHRTQDHNQAI